MKLSVVTYQLVSLLIGVLLACSWTTPASANFGFLARGFAGSTIARGTMGRSMFGRTMLGRSSMGRSSFGRSSFGRSSFGRTPSPASRTPGRSGWSTKRAPTRKNNFGGKTKTPTTRTKPKPNSNVKPKSAPKAKPTATKPTSTAKKARPSWRQSEKDVEGMFRRNSGRTTSTQKSFLGGNKTSYGKKGSTRPDISQTSSRKAYSVEVKNYKVTTPAGRSRLVNNVTKQAKHRSANLKSGTRQQVVIDTRGQNVSFSQLKAMKADIVTKSGGVLKPNQISLLHRFK